MAGEIDPSDHARDDEDRGHREPPASRQRGEPAAREQAQRCNDDGEDRERADAVEDRGAVAELAFFQERRFAPRERARRHVLGVAATTDRAPEQAGAGWRRELDRDRSGRQDHAILHEPAAGDDVLADDEPRRPGRFEADDQRTTARDREIARAVIELVERRRRDQRAHAEHQRDCRDRRGDDVRGLHLMSPGHVKCRPFLTRNV